MLLQKFSRRVINAIRQRKAKRSTSKSAKFLRPMLETLERRELLAVVISEVHPTGSSSSYAADWFEVTNTGNSALNIAGWKMDDNTNLFANSVALRGLTSIPAGKSAVFFEGLADGSTDAAKIASFSTAWFGSPTPPAGFLIGAYGGAAVGLSSSGDAVNLYDGGGVLQANVTFGAATTGTTFDNTAGLNNAPISTLSVAGINGAFAAGGETGSPGTRGISVDLSTYVRVGRYDLPEPTRTAAPANNLLAQEASGVAYNWDTDSLFIVGDGGKSVTQVSKTGVLIDTMTLALGGSPQGTEFYDVEGITYIGNGKFVMSEERDRQLVLFTYAAGTTLFRGDALTVKLGTFVDNTGTEGLSYDPQTSGYIVVKEITPQGIFQTGVDFPAGTATNGSPTTVNSVDLFNPALANMLDFADVFALSNLPSLNGHPDSGKLLLLSQASARIVEIDRSGTISSTLQIVADLGSPLSAPDQQHEGLTMDRDGILYVVNENGGGDIDHPQLWVYMPSEVPNQAPTGIALNNVITSIVENTTTVAPIKVADIVVTDDGLGSNTLTVGGTDAAYFEITGSGLYIKAGTVLDYETKITYNITVNVDDPTLGGAPDATTSYALTVTDVVDETPVVPAVFISEVHPSGSGNISYAADWFEVTNNGTTAVNITGWSVDDNSNGTGKIPLRGLTSIPAGKSAVFFEGLADGSTDAAKIASFSTAWFGSATLPAGFLIGAYGGAGIGLSTGGDAVNLFDAGGNRISGVSFGTATTGVSFDNHAGLGSPALPLPAISTLSVVGIHGAFLSFNGVETGSPGTTGKLVISEVAPWSSGNSPLVGADWFELTNTGATTVDITGWKVDDNSESFVAAVALNGITSIAAGESVIFIETTDLPGKTAAFLSNWFGASPPANLRIGNYSGSGVGLSTTSDAVNLYENSGVLHAKVFFGASTGSAPFRSFDNAAGLNNAAISQLSAAGINGAFVAVNDANEIGSPGKVLNTPAAISGTATGNVKEGNNVNASGNLTLSGSLTVTDPDFGQSTFNTGVTTAVGDLGSLTITASGSFSYTVANSAVQYLGAGQTKIDTFTVSSLDGSASQLISITIVGVTAGFTGVAAGDATASGVVLWTRTYDTATASQPGITENVTLQIATDAGFSSIVQTLHGVTNSIYDNTLKIPATGLASNTNFYYRFVADGTSETSITGKFKTTPAANEDVPVHFAFSGDNDGLMRPYALASVIPSQNLDFYINLGDVIYENASNVAGNNGASYLNSPSVTLSNDSLSFNGVPRAFIPAGTPFATQAQLQADYAKKYRENFLPVNVGGQNSLQDLYAAQANYTTWDNHELGNRKYIDGGAPAGGSVGGPLGTDMPTGRGVDARANGTGNPLNVNDAADLFTSAQLAAAGGFMNESTGFQTLENVFLAYQPIANRGIISAPTDPRTDGTKQLYSATQWGENAIYVNTDSRSYRDIRLKTANSVQRGPRKQHFQDDRGHRCLRRRKRLIARPDTSDRCPGRGLSKWSQSGSGQPW